MFPLGIDEKGDTMTRSRGRSAFVDDSTTDSEDLAARGREIKRRRMAHGYSVREAHELSGIGRPQITKAEEGGSASPLTYARLENWLDKVDESFGMSGDDTDAPVAIMEIVIEGDFGVRVVVKGPITEPEALERSATRLIAQIRANKQDQD